MDDSMMELFLESLLTGDVSGAIVNQEKRGQLQQEGAETLPRKCPRQNLEQLGFVFGEDADDLFVYVTFPEGWKKQRTNHSMWTDLLDDKNRKRGSIFYKAACYDRDAFMHLSRRYGAGIQPLEGFEDNYHDQNYYGVVTDDDQIVWHTEDYATYEELNKKKLLADEAKNWLEEHYPDHADVLAYWED
jgi:hypothetical protein